MLNPSAQEETTPPAEPANRPFKDFQKINHSEQLEELMATLFSSGNNSDVTFQVEDRQFPAHRAILSVRSPELFAKSPDNTTGAVIELPDKRATPFEIFLRYLYTCDIDLGELDLETATDVVAMAHEYQVPNLIADLSSILQKVVGKDTVFQLFECALLLDKQNGLASSCRKYLNTNATEILKDSRFFKLSKKALIELVSADDFYADEMDILTAVCHWHEENKDEDLKDVLEKIRFHCVNVNVASFAPTLKLLIENGIDLDKIGQQGTPSSPNYLPPRKPACSSSERKISTDYLMSPVSPVSPAIAKESSHKKFSSPTSGTPGTHKQFCRFGEL